MATHPDQPEDPADVDDPDAYKWVIVGGVPANAETALGTSYRLSWRRVADRQYLWEVTDMLRPVAQGVARNRPLARTAAEKAARRAGDSPWTDRAGWPKSLTIFNTDGTPQITATVLSDDHRDPFVLQIGDRIRLAMSGDTLQDLADAVEALTRQGEQRGML